jgi:hypothetical protein
VDTARETGVWLPVPYCFCSRSLMLRRGLRRGTHCPRVGMRISNLNSLAIRSVPYRESQVARLLQYANKAWHFPPAC